MVTGSVNGGGEVHSDRFGSVSSAVLEESTEVAVRAESVDPNVEVLSTPGPNAPLVNRVGEKTGSLKLEEVVYVVDLLVG